MSSIIIIVIIMIAVSIDRSIDRRALARVAAARTMARTIGDVRQDAERLDGLAEAHVVAEDRIDAELVQGSEPENAVDLVRQQRGREQARRAVAALRGDVGLDALGDLATLGREALDERQLGACLHRGV